jgi:hypothetical protein
VRPKIVSLLVVIVSGVVVALPGAIGSPAGATAPRGASSGIPPIAYHQQVGLTLTNIPQGSHIHVQYHDIQCSYSLPQSFTSPRNDPSEYKFSFGVVNHGACLTKDTELQYTVTVRRPHDNEQIASGTFTIKGGSRHWKATVSNCAAKACNLEWKYQTHSVNFVNLDMTA